MEATEGMRQLKTSHKINQYLCELLTHHLQSTLDVPDTSLGSVPYSYLLIFGNGLGRFLQQALVASSQ